MNPIKESPYLPCTPALAAGGRLVTIRQAAAAEQACEDTLKNNAKTGRLRAYQSHFGAPVMVLPDEVEDFLRARSDIASRHHPKSVPAVRAAGTPSAPRTSLRTDSPFPDESGGGSVIGDLGLQIKITGLNHAHRSEIARVAACFIEVGRQLSEHANHH